MSKGFLALLAFLITLVATIAPITASQGPVSTSTAQSNDLQTKVLQDFEGNVHVLWLVPARNNSASGPGMWYSKYSPNGTDTIPPTRITNSTSIQSANLAVDTEGNAVIIWAEDNAKSFHGTSALYLLHFNSTQERTSQVATRQGSQILWPSLAIGENDTIYMTWTEYNPRNANARVEYGKLTSAGALQTEQLASYARADAFPPQTNLVFDNSSQRLQVAWGESQKDGRSASTVDYAKLGANGTVLTRLQIAKFGGILREVTMTGMSGQDGAFVLWRTLGGNASLYVSQISPEGDLVYVKQLSSPLGQSRYLAVSTGPDDNLYVVWYQPSVGAAQNSATPANATNMTFVRMSVTGTVDQIGTGVFKDPIIGVAVLSDGMVYGVSPNGLVSVITPTEPRNDLLAMSAIALVSCFSIAGFAGSIVLEEGRYRWTTLYSRVSKRPTDGTGQEALKLLARKPGLKIREIKHLTRAHPVSTMALIQMEKNGLLASFREGMSRRFYVRDRDAESADALRTRILLRILDHPGVWEAQLAKDLGLSQQIVHYHLKKLRETRLVAARIDANGTRKFYRCVDSGSSNHEKIGEQ